MQHRNICCVNLPHLQLANILPNMFTSLHYLSTVYTVQIIINTHCITFYIYCVFKTASPTPFIPNQISPVIQRKLNQNRKYFYPIGQWLRLVRMKEKTEGRKSRWTSTYNKISNLFICLLVRNGYLLTWYMPF